MSDIFQLDRTSLRWAGQFCLACGAVVLVGSKEPSGGAVALTVCPAVDRKYFTCDGRMVPLVEADVVYLLGASDRSEAVPTAEMTSNIDGICQSCKMKCDADEMICCIYCLSCDVRMRLDEL